MKVSWIEEQLHGQPIKFLKTNDNYLEKRGGRKGTLLFNGYIVLALPMKKFWKFILHNVNIYNTT